MITQNDEDLKHGYKTIFLQQTTYQVLHVVCCLNVFQLFYTQKLYRFYFYVYMLYQDV